MLPWLDPRLKTRLLAFQSSCCTPFHLGSVLQACNVKKAGSRRGLTKAVCALASPALG